MAPENSDPHLSGDKNFCLVPPFAKNVRTLMKRAGKCKNHDKTFTMLDHAYHQIKHINEQ